jgi:anaerobic C4-dicarboxylate transporter
MLYLPIIGALAVNNTIIINDLLMYYAKYFLTDKEQIVAVLEHPDDGMRNTSLRNSYRYHNLKS